MGSRILCVLLLSACAIPPSQAQLGVLSAGASIIPYVLQLPLGPQILKTIALVKLRAAAAIASYAYQRRKAWFGIGDSDQNATMEKDGARHIGIPTEPTNLHQESGGYSESPPNQAPGNDANEQHAASTAHKKREDKSAKQTIKTESSSKSTFYKVLLQELKSRTNASDAQVRKWLIKKLLSQNKNADILKDFIQRGYFKEKQKPKHPVPLSPYETLRSLRSPLSDLGQGQGQVMNIPSSSIPPAMYPSLNVPVSQQAYPTVRFQNGPTHQTYSYLNHGPSGQGQGQAYNNPNLVASYQHQAYNNPNFGASYQHPAYTDPNLGASFHQAYTDPNLGASYQHQAYNNLNLGPSYKHQAYNNLNHISRNYQESYNYNVDPGQGSRKPYYASERPFLGFQPEVPNIPGTVTRSIYGGSHYSEHEPWQPLPQIGDEPWTPVLRKRRSAPEPEVLELDLDRALDALLRNDQLGCSLRLVCELSGLPMAGLREDEQLILEFIRIHINSKTGKERKESRGMKAYSFAAMVGVVGHHSKDPQVCGRVYDRCPFSGNYIMTMLRKASV